MIRNSAEHEAHRQQVLKQFDDEATTKFWALMPTFRDNTEEALYALADIEGARGLTPSEKRIKVGLFKLEMLRAALSCFTPAGGGARTTQSLSLHCTPFRDHKHGFAVLQ